MQTKIAHEVSTYTVKLTVNTPYFKIFSVFRTTFSDWEVDK